MIEQLYLTLLGNYIRLGNTPENTLIDWKSNLSSQFSNGSKTDFSRWLSNLKSIVIHHYISIPSIQVIEVSGASSSTFLSTRISHARISMVLTLLSWSMGSDLRGSIKGSTRV